MSERSEEMYLEDMLVAAGRAIAYCEGKTFDEFLRDTKTQDAVVRNLEIFGEAVKKLSDEVRQAQKNVPWTNIAGMRDRLIHNYFGVNWDIVWNVVTNDLPRLIPEIQAVIAAARTQNHGPAISVNPHE